MKWKLPWLRHNLGNEKAETEERLHAAEADDERVDRVARRAARLMRENNFGPVIMNALGIRRG